MHNPVNSAISFGILFAVVGGSFFFVSETAPPRLWTGIIAGGIITPDAPEELRRDQDHGFLILAIAPSSPADRAGLRGGGEETIVIGNQEIPIGGDIIVRIDNVQINQREDICAVLGQKQVGDSAVFEVSRDGSLQEFNVVLEELPPGERTSC